MKNEKFKKVLKIIFMVLCTLCFISYVLVILGFELVLKNPNDYQWFVEGTIDLHYMQVSYLEFAKFFMLNLVCSCFFSLALLCGYYVFNKIIDDFKKPKNK